MRIVSVALMGLSLSGCIYVNGGARNTETDELTFDEPVGEIAFDLAAGNLDVRTADVAEVTVVRHWSYGNDRPDVRADVQGDTLVLEVDCRNVFGNCWVDHELVVPYGVDVWGTTGSGDVLLTDIGGFLDVETGSGDVIASGLDATGALVETGSGNVALDFDDKPDGVDIDTGSGDVRVDLPSGSYDVDIDTGSGDIHLDGIESNSGATRTITVNTGSGDVTIRGF